MWQTSRGNKIIGYLSLFTSFGTLLCCAIPSSLVLLGFGASLAGFLGDFPQLTWLSEHKELVFGLSFFFLGVSAFAQGRSSKRSCPVNQKDDCERARTWSRPLFWFSLGINTIGVFYAFILPRLL